MKTVPPIVKQFDEAEKLETLLGVSEETLQILSQQRCADCAQPTDAHAMWYTPQGPICRTCRDARLAQPSVAPRRP
jgi:hypothetical protein